MSIFIKSRLQAPAHHQISYEPEIDGLRAFAVLAVMVFHFNQNLLPGGYFGVDVFFVISGYLITRLIRAGIHQDNFSLSEFYIRRAKRLLPNLYCVILAALAISTLVLMPNQYNIFLGSIQATLVFFSNFYFWDQTGYFAPAAEQMPLLHTWSLSIEEQFYLLLPGLLILFRSKHKWLCVLVAIGILASLLVSEWLAQNHRSVAFYFTPSRAWELLAGVLLALAADILRGRVPAKITYVAFVVLALHVVHPPFASSPPGLLVLPVVICSAILIIGLPEAPAARRFFVNKTALYIGKISYSLYLWHFMFLALYLSWTSKPDPMELSSIFALSIVTSMAAFHWLEQPMRRASFSGWKIIIYMLAFTLALFATAEVLKKWGDDRVHIFANQQQLHDFQVVSDAIWKFDFDENQPCRNIVDIQQHQMVERLNDCWSDERPAIIVLGDSHAEDLYNALYQVTDYPVLLSLAKGGCRLGIDQRSECQFDEKFQFILDNKQRIKAVLFTESGSHYLEGSNRRPYPHHAHFENAKSKLQSLSEVVM